MADITKHHAKQQHATDCEYPGWINLGITWCPIATRQGNKWHQPAWVTYNRRYLVIFPGKRRMTFHMHGVIECQLQLINHRWQFCFRYPAVNYGKPSPASGRAPQHKSRFNQPECPPAGQQVIHSFIGSSDPFFQVMILLGLQHLATFCQFMTYFFRCIIKGFRNGKSPVTCCMQNALQVISSLTE